MNNPKMKCIQSWILWSLPTKTHNYKQSKNREAKKKRFAYFAWTVTFEFTVKLVLNQISLNHVTKVLVFLLELSMWDERSHFTDFAQCSEWVNKQNASILRCSCIDDPSRERHQLSEKIKNAQHIFSLQTNDRILRRLQITVSVVLYHVENIILSIFLSIIFVCYWLIILNPNPYPMHYSDRFCIRCPAMVTTLCKLFMCKIWQRVLQVCLCLYFPVLVWLYHTPAWTSAEAISHANWLRDKHFITLREGGVRWTEPGRLSNTSLLLLCD